MNFSDIFTKIAERYPENNVQLPPSVPVYHCRSCSDYVEVAQPDDLCPACTTEKARGYQAQVLAGRCANGSELDHGTRNHAVMFGQYKALCGAKPGRRSVGWSTPWKSREITCPRCLKKLAKVQPIEEIAASFGATAEVVRHGYQLCDLLEQARQDAEIAEDSKWLGLLDIVLHPEGVEGYEPPTVEAATAVQYGDADLGTRCTISGGEVAELDSHLEARYEECFDEDLPY